MSYNETMARIIKNSSLTLREIANKCKTEHQVKIDPSYLSKLQSMNHPPASDDVNKAVAIVCNADPEELLFEAYIDKAPEPIRKFIINMENYLRKITKTMVQNQMPKKTTNYLNEAIDKTPKWEFIKAMLNEDNFTLPNKYNTHFTKSNDPKLKNILTTVNPLLGLEMTDDSMEPIIPKGVKMQLADPEEIKENDIVVALIKNDKFIRRYIDLGNKVVLIAENSRFAPIKEDKKSVVIVAKIKSFTKEI